MSDFIHHQFNNLYVKISNNGQEKVVYYRIKVNRKLWHATAIIINCTTSMVKSWSILRFGKWELRFKRPYRSAWTRSKPLHHDQYTHLRVASIRIMWRWQHRAAPSISRHLEHQNKPNISNMQIQCIMIMLVKLKFKGFGVGLCMLTIIQIFRH